MVEYHREVHVRNCLTDILDVLTAVDLAPPANTFENDAAVQLVMCDMLQMIYHGITSVPRVLVSTRFRTEELDEANVKQLNEEGFGVRKPRTRKLRRSKRKVGAPGVGCKCRRNCTANFSSVERFQIFMRYSEAGPVEKKVILTRGIIPMRIQRRRPRKIEGKQRTSMFKYSIVNDGIQTDVCLKAYASFFGVSVSMVKIAAAFYRKSGVAKTPGYRKLTQERIAEIETRIRNHVGSFPAKPSHYSRRKSKRVYLDSHLNKRLMHRLYLQIHEPEAYDKWKATGFSRKLQSKCSMIVKESRYVDFVRKNFKLSFRPAAVDKCMTCHHFDVKIANSKDKISKLGHKMAKQSHKDEANKFYAIGKTARKQKDVLVIEYDCQKVHPLPAIPIQEAYYLRQLSFNTFGQVCSKHGSKDRTQMTTWVEDEANKGPDVIASLVRNFADASKTDEDTTKVHAISDATPAQNRNTMTMAMEFDAVVNGPFECYRHTFPVRGHSFLKCDQKFGTQEQNIRKVENVYTPDEYVEVGFC